MDEFLEMASRAGFPGWKTGECYAAGKDKQDQIVPVSNGRLW